jgi:cytochrome c-type biogenesis protein CcmF
VRNLAAVAAFGLAAFVLVANAGALGRTVRTFARAQSRPVLRAAPAALTRNRRLTGGLIVHLGVAVAAVGITASTSFAKSSEFSLRPGQSRTFEGYTLTYRGVHTIVEPQRVVKVADVSVARHGGSIGTLTPSMNLYHDSSEPIGTPSIEYGAFKDLYSSLIGVEGSGRLATFRFFLNPGVLWLWVGGCIMALGGLIALWPERRRLVAAAVPSAARELAEARR